MFAKDNTRIVIEMMTNDFLDLSKRFNKEKSKKEQLELLKLQKAILEVHDDSHTLENIYIHNKEKYISDSPIIVLFHNLDIWSKIKEVYENDYIFLNFKLSDQTKEIFDYFKIDEIALFRIYLGHDRRHKLIVKYNGPLVYGEIIKFICE